MKKFKMLQSLFSGRGFLLSSTMFSFQIKKKLAFYLEVQVPESEEGVERLRIHIT